MKVRIFLYIVCYIYAHVFIAAVGVPGNGAAAEETGGGGGATGGGGEFAPQNVRIIPIGSEGGWPRILCHFVVFRCASKHAFLFEHVALLASIATVGHSFNVGALATLPQPA